MQFNQRAGNCKAKAQAISAGRAIELSAGLIERLCSEKLVDDRRYVESFISYRAARGQGPHRVRMDLRKIGLPGQMVEQGLAAYDGWIADLMGRRSFDPDPSSINKTIG